MKRYIADPCAQPDARQEDVCDTFCPTYCETGRLRARIKEVSGLSEIFKVLGDETRTKIVALLAEAELCVCDLADLLNMTMPAVSHHLRLLKAMRLVKYRREGKMVYYSLDDDHIVRLINEAEKHFAEER